MESIDMESATLRQRLEAAEGALKLQTIRCCQLVTEYTGKLQRKDEQLCCEQQLRDRQLSYVLQALRLFEERLQREQKTIRQLLQEKDDVISTQKQELNRLRTPDQHEQPQEKTATYYCNNCQIMFDTQNSLTRNRIKIGVAEVMAAVSSGEDCSSKSEGSSESAGGLYMKNRSDPSRNIRRSKKCSAARKQNTDTRRLEAVTPFSSSSDEQEDRTAGKNTAAPDDADVCFRRQPSFSNWVDSLHGVKRVNEVTPLDVQQRREEVVKNESDGSIVVDNNLTKNADVTKDEDSKFDENWYTNTSDAEDSNIPEVYKDNPVLECVNQILLQNSLDANSSEDSSPKLSSKRVQFAAQDTVMSTAHTVTVPKGIIANSTKSSDHSPKSPKMVKFNLEAADSEREYETPIECFNYEIQSIYSNDYEPILLGNRQYNIRNVKSNPNPSTSDTESHYYVDMDVPKTGQSNSAAPKISKIPPALPPKPPNLISKYKIHKRLENRMSSDVVERAQQINEAADVMPEPDYCSISELNEQIVEKPITRSKETQKFTKPRVIEAQVEVHEIDIPIAKVAPVTRIQPVKAERTSKPSDNCKYISADIPKLPQVSEILIPNEDHFDQDNYIKHKPKLLNCKKINTEENKFQNSSFHMCNSVSDILTEINKTQTPKRVAKYEPNEKKTIDLDNNNGQNDDLLLQTFENYDLSQTFEEFKLDENEINDMEVEEYLIGDNQDFVFHESDENDQCNENINEHNENQTVDSIPSYGLSKNTILASQFMRTQLLPEENLSSSEDSNEQIKTPTPSQDDINNQENELKDRVTKNYETFLETSGLSSKSIQALYKVNGSFKLRAGGKQFNGMKPGTTVKYWSGPYL